MQTKVLNTEEAPCKWWAARDAGLRNAVNQSNWTTKQRARAEGMKWALDLLYEKKAIYISYGKRSISIKIDDAHVKDNKNLALLEKDYEKQGVIKKITTQGVIYTIKA